MARKTKKTKEQTAEDKRIQEIKSRFQFWLYEKYEIDFIPKWFFNKLEKVYDGTHDNLTKPIPVEDLWDMWDRKMPYLLKTYDRNKRMGKNMDGTLRMSYDLAILLSKYDSYLTWKEQQKQALIEKEKKQSERNIDYSNIVQPSVLKTKNKIDINSIIDEI